MKQITIVTEDAPGLLARVSELLADRNINIDSLDAEAIEDHGVIILTVDRCDDALAALRDAGIPAVSEDALLLRIPDTPGALARISRRFHDAGIGLRSLRILRRAEGYGLVAVSVERTDEAMELVRDVLVS